MYGTQTAHPGTIDAFQCAYPQLKVGIHRVLDENCELIAAMVGQRGKHVGNFLHSKRICRSAGSNPKHIDTGMESLVDMTLGGYFGCYEHTGFFLHLGKPFESRGPDALKPTGFGARFPHTGTKHTHTGCGQRTSCVQSLLLALGAARTGNDKRRSHFLIAKKRQ